MQMEDALLRRGAGCGQDVHTRRPDGVDDWLAEVVGYAEECFGLVAGNREKTSRVLRRNDERVAQGRGMVRRERHPGSSASNHDRGRLASDNLAEHARRIAGGARHKVYGTLTVSHSGFA